MRTIRLDGNTLGWDGIRAALEGPVRVRIPPASWARVRESRRILERAIDRGDRVYGVNTGFGSLAEVRIGREDAQRLQQNLILSHAAGTGRPLPPGETRLMILLRMNALVRGDSGCSPQLVEALSKLVARDVLPVVPEEGSVGASGDLVPLSHIGACLLGKGEAWLGGRRTSASGALRRAGIRPHSFLAKDALCLINGTQFSLALLASGVLRARRFAKTADAAAAMTVDGLMASVRPFDPRLHAARPHPGQLRVARNLRRLLRGSRIVEAHAGCPKVQDSYSLRCVPQIHGAVREVLDWVERAVLREVNASSDNPLVFGPRGTILSGGNFHGMLLAHAADALTAAMTTLANVSERRIELLTNPDRSGLPAFLSPGQGLHSGYMMLQVSAASLAAECRTLSFPAAVSNIPTSAGREDMVSMSAISARHLRDVLDRLQTVLAIEVMCAAQALDFRRPLRPGIGAEAARASIRRVVRPLRADRFLKPDLDAARQWLAERLLEDVEAAVGPLE